MTSSTVTVVVADPSADGRRRVREALQGDPAFELAGEARTVEEALALVRRLGPRTVLLDGRLPGVLELVEQLMALCPVPIVVRCRLARDDLAAAALAAGAVDVLADDAFTPAALRDRLRVAARVRVIRHLRGRLRPDRTASADGPDLRLVAIGASTGGPAALLQVLSALPAGFGAAVLVVQHMADGFLGGLAEWLDTQLALPVAVGTDGGRLHPGTVTLAQGGGNLLVQAPGLVTRQVPPDPAQFHVPSIDTTLCSVAEQLGARAVGVLLTGMGRDGARGLRAMRERGAVTLGQDEASSAVYGMPAAAVQLGAVQTQLPLDQIGPALVALLRRAA